MPSPEYANQADIYRFGLSQEALKDISWENHLRPAVQAASLKFISALASSNCFSAHHPGYGLPLVSWGEDVREAVAVLATWTVYAVRGIRPGDSVLEHPLKIRADAINKWLEGIATNKYCPEVEGTEGGDPIETPVGESELVDTPLVASNEQRGYHTVSSCPPTSDFWQGFDPFSGRRGCR